MRMINRNCEVILRRLLIADAPISSADIQTSLALSRKTLSIEIQRLDTFLNQYGARVRTVSGIGYVIEKTDSDRFDSFSEKFLLHVYRDRYMYFDRNYLAYLMILELLVSDGYITIEGLIEKYHYSSGTISKNLQIAKAYFERFRLNIVARPNYGLILQGREWDVRICILFMAKIANGINFLQQNPIPVIQKFREMLEKDLDNYFDIKMVLEPVMQKYNVYCPLVYQMLIAYYVFLSQSRMSRYENLGISPEHIQRIRKTVHWCAAQELAAAFAAKGYAIRENDAAAIAILMRCYASHRDVNEFDFSEFELCKKDTQNFLSMVTELYPGIESRFDVEFFSEFVCFLAGLRERIFFQMPSDEEIIYAAKHDALFTADLCIDFARMFQSTHGIALSSAELMPAYYIINSAFTRKAYVQAQYRAALVSFYGIHFARNMAARLMRIYNKIIIEIIPMELAEANRTDLTKFDLIITDIAKNQFCTSTVPLIFSDFYREDHLRSLERFISESIAAHLRIIVQNANIIRDLNFLNKEDAIKYLADHFIRDEDRDAFIDDCLRTNGFLSCERKNRIALVSADPRFYDKAEIVILFSKAAFYWDNEQVQMIILYNSRGRAYEDIKKTNIFIRRLMGDVAGVVQRVSGMDAEELISYIARQKFKQ